MALTDMKQAAFEGADDTTKSVALTVQHREIDRVTADGTLEYHYQSRQLLDANLTTIADGATVSFKVADGGGHEQLWSLTREGQVYSVHCCGVSEEGDQVGAGRTTPTNRLGMQHTAEEYLKCIDPAQADLVRSELQISHEEVQATLDHIHDLKRAGIWQPNMALRLHELMGKEMQ